MTGEARKRLGDVMAASIKGDAASKPEALEAERAKPLRAPVVIAVGVDKPIESKVSDIENVCAAAAASQNMLLAATALGLASIWRTGGAVDDPAVKKFLGFASDQHLLGFIYLGYPANPPKERSRPSFEDRTVWME
jgi:nitroreductase